MALGIEGFTTETRRTRRVRGLLNGEDGFGHRVIHHGDTENTERLEDSSDNALTQYGYIEVDEQPNPTARQFEIGEELGFVNWKYHYSGPMNSDSKMGVAKVHSDHDPQTLHARPESWPRAGTVQGRRDSAGDRVPGS